MPIKYTNILHLIIYSISIIITIKNIENYLLDHFFGLRIKSKLQRKNIMIDQLKNTNPNHDYIILQDLSVLDGQNGFAATGLLFYLAHNPINERSRSLGSRGVVGQLGYA